MQIAGSGSIIKTKSQKQRCRQSIDLLQPLVSNFRTLSGQFHHSESAHCSTGKRNCAPTSSFAAQHGSIIDEHVQGLANYTAEQQLVWHCGNRKVTGMREVAYECYD